MSLPFVVITSLDATTYHGESPPDEYDLPIWMHLVFGNLLLRGVPLLA